MQLAPTRTAFTLLLALSLACGDDSTPTIDASIDAADAGDAGLDMTLDTSDNADADADAGPDADADAGPDSDAPDADTPEGFGNVLNGRWSDAFGLAGASGVIGSSVRDVDLDGEVIYAGGLFETISGVAARNVARWTGTAWEALGEGVPDLVLAVAWDGARNRLYAGGQSGGGFLPTPRFVYAWDGSAWTPFGSVDGGDVYAITVLADGRVAVGGNFTGIDGVEAPGIAVWNGTEWSRWGSALSEGDQVLAIYERPAGEPCIAGGFSADFADGRGVACWDSDMSEWVALSEGLAPGRVFALLADGDDGELIAGGEFGYTDGDTGDVRAGLARWDGASWSVFAGGVSGGDINRVRSLARDSEGRVIIGGRFGVVDPLGEGVRASGTAVWDGSAWAAFGDLQDPLEVFIPGLAGAHDIAIQDDGDVVLGGIFLQVDGAIASGIALRSDGPWQSLQAAGATFEGLGGSGFHVAAGPDDALFIVGGFSFAGSVRANGVASWNGAGWEALGAGLPDDAAVSATAVDPATGELVIGGEFTLSQDGRDIRNLARWDGTGWRAIGDAPDGPVSALSYGPGGDLLVGGFFSAIGEVRAQRVARWDGSAWTALGQGLGGSADEGVGAIAEGPDGTVWATGSFVETGAGDAAQGFARFDGSAWSEAGGGLREGSTVLALKADARGAWLSGQFASASDGTTLNSIGGWNGTEWIALGDGLTAFGMPAFVSDFVLAGDQVIATGTFGPEALEADHLAWWNGESWQAIGMGMSDLGESLAVSGNTLWVAGLFAAAGDAIPSFGVARWTWQ
ncbi:MAG: hypothetical protein AAF938_08080 [Myxococcota bacterium]